MRFCTSLYVTVPVLFGAVGTSNADILYASDRGILTRIDTDALTAQPIGDMGIFAVAGLEFGPGGRLYGIDADANELIEIDINSGAVSVVGPLLVDAGRSTGLGWDHTTSTMYSTYAVLGSDDFLSTINLTDGQASPVAELSDILGARLVGLDFDPLGYLYGLQGGGTARLWVVDKETGEAKPSGPDSLPISGSLTITPDGTAWSIATGGTLYSIDLEDGTPTIYGALTGFSPGTPVIGSLTYIPAPLTPAMFGAGCIVSQRRRRK